jgi:hypothetical protein
MMRGVSRARAIWAATRRELKVKTMKVSIAAMNICSKFWMSVASNCRRMGRCTRVKPKGNTIIIAKQIVTIRKSIRRWLIQRHCLDVHEPVVASGEHLCVLV